MMSRETHISNKMKMLEKLELGQTKIRTYTLEESNTITRVSLHIDKMNN
jgi:hypothetical protein